MDKNKIIEAAAKLIAKGAYDKAIKEYQRILDADPKDIRILQKMGELHLKKNDTAQAVLSFSKVAESYSADGFFLKSVAMYKQVLKINPNLVEVNGKLAELHQQLGLMSEAMAYHQLVANAQDKAGDTRASLDTLKKMVDLDPDNVASRIKLAELYAREKMDPQATAEFKRAADYLKKVNRGDDYLRVAERIAHLEPDNVGLAKELAQAYLARSDQKRALAKLQVCFKADPRDVETLTLLGEAFQGLGQTSKTVSVYKELAKLAGESNRTAEANGWWSKIEQLDPNDPDVLARRAPPAPPAARPPSSPARAQVAAPGPDRGAPPPTPVAAPPRKDQLAKLLTETDVYLKYGLYDKALDHLRRVFTADPESLDAHEKAYQIYVAAKQGPQAAEQLLNVLRLCTRRADVARAPPYLDALIKQNPSHPELPAFLAVLRPDGGGPPAPALEDEDEILVDPADDELLVEPELEPEPVVDLALEAAGAGPADVLEDEPLGDEPFAAMGETDPGIEPIELEVEEPAIQDVALEVVSDGDGELIEEPLAEPEPLLDAPAAELVEPFETEAFETEAFEPEPEPFEVAAEPDLAPVDDSFEFGTQVTDVGLSAVEPLADEELETVEEITGAGAPVELEPLGDDGLTDEMSTQTAVAFETPVGFEGPGPLEEPVSFDDAPGSEEQVEAPPDEDPLSEECDEAAFFLEQGVTEEAREILETVLIASPGHPRATELLARLDRMEAGGSDEVTLAGVPAPPPERDAFDLAAELADELGEIQEEVQEEEEALAGPVGGDYQVSVEEVFSEFKKGLAKVVKPEDVDTHYDLGIAYKEMGLVDDAIGEFNVAREGCAGKKKEIDCLSMIGLLAVQKGDGAMAVDALKEALGNEFAQGEVAKGLIYELAVAHETAGSPGKALFCFQHVAQLDASFRDVSAQVDRLAAQTAPESESLPSAAPRGKPPTNPSGAPAAARAASPSSAAPPKSRKVGYL